jgi:hypothetical protein
MKEKWNMSYKTMCHMALSYGRTWEALAADTEKEHDNL